VLYGFPPRHLGLDPSTAAPVPELSNWLQEHELMQQLVCQHLLRAQERMKRQADKHRVEHQFAVGDMVFLKLQPYVQSSVAPSVTHKLAFKFFGPYGILAHVGKVAYRLQLSASALVHLIFHVSQLKRSLGSQTVSVMPPSNLVKFQVPVRILQRRST
jgi:ribosomal protein L21E